MANVAVFRNKTISDVEVRLQFTDGVLAQEFESRISRHLIRIHVAMVSKPTLIIKIDSSKATLVGILRTVSKSTKNHPSIGQTDMASMILVIVIGVKRLVKRVIACDFERTVRGFQVQFTVISIIRSGHPVTYIGLTLVIDHTHHDV